jgi:hypothetical protein
LGINAVLPTGRHARTTSPLSVFDFMKRMSVGYVTAGGYPGLAQDARTHWPFTKGSMRMHGAVSDGARAISQIVGYTAAK